MGVGSNTKGGGTIASATFLAAGSTLQTIVRYRQRRQKSWHAITTWIHKIGYEDHYSMRDLTHPNRRSVGSLNCARLMGSVVIPCGTPDADVDAIISDEWAVVERERETQTGRDGRRCPDQSAVCKLVGRWFGFTP